MQLRNDFLVKLLECSSASFNLSICRNAELRSHFTLFSISSIPLNFLNYSDDDNDYGNEDDDGDGDNGDSNDNYSYSEDVQASDILCTTKSGRTCRTW